MICYEIYPIETSLLWNREYPGIKSSNPWLQYTICITDTDYDGSLDIIFKINTLMQDWCNSNLSKRFIIIPMDLKFKFVLFLESDIDLMLFKLRFA